MEASSWEMAFEAGEVVDARGAILYFARTRGAQGDVQVENATVTRHERTDDGLTVFISWEETEPRPLVFRREAVGAPPILDSLTWIREETSRVRDESGHLIAVASADASEVLLAEHRSVRDRFENRWTALRRLRGKKREVSQFFYFFDLFTDVEALRAWRSDDDGMIDAMKAINEDDGPSGLSHLLYRRVLGHGATVRGRALDPLPRGARLERIRSSVEHVSGVLRPLILSYFHDPSDLGGLDRKAFQAAFESFVLGKLALERPAERVDAQPNSAAFFHFPAFVLLAIELGCHDGTFWESALGPLVYAADLYPRYYRAVDKKYAEYGLGCRRGLGVEQELPALRRTYARMRAVEDLRSQFARICARAFAASIELLYGGTEDADSSEG